MTNHERNLLNRINVWSKKPTTLEYALFQKASNATGRTAEKAAALFAEFKTPADHADIPNAFRRHLEAQGFKYDNRSLNMQDMLGKRSGNCLGLTMLFGAELLRRGIATTFELTLNPRDLTYEEEPNMLHDLEEIIDEDSPLPEEHIKEPNYRFVPNEHPRIIIDGKCLFETTYLASDVEEDPTFIAPAERIKTIPYSEVALNVIIDNYKNSMNGFKAPDYKKMKNWVEENKKPLLNNREAWSFIHDAAQENFDDALAEEAQKIYLQIAGEDSRFYFNKFQMTGDESALNHALELYPSYLSAYVARNVLLEPNRQKAKRHFIVAAECAARSSEIDLGNFYLMYIEAVVEFFGEQEIIEMGEALELDKKCPNEFFSAFYHVTKSDYYLDDISRDTETWPKSPRERTLFCLKLADAIPECARELDNLKTEHTDSASFQALFNSFK